MTQDTLKAFSLISNRLSPVAPGTPITWTAEASGSTGPLEYRFYLRNVATGTWTLEQDYSTASSLTWTPPATGDYYVQVWVRHVGSTEPSEAIRTSPTITVASGPVQNGSMAVSQSFPVAVPVPIRFTANASGGTAPLEYRFYLYDTTSASWTLVQDWSPTNQWSWTPGSADYGVRAVQVWIRSTGSTVNHEIYIGTGLFVLVR